MRFLIVALATVGVLCAGNFVDETKDMDSPTNKDMKTVTDLKSIQRAFDTSSPRDNVVIVKWAPEITTKLRLRTMVETLIVLPPEEEIVSFPLGDTYTFKVKPVITDAYNTKNMFTVRPELAGADTNLAVVGSSGRIYNFYLRSDDHNSQFLPIFTAYVTLDGEIPNMSLKVEETQKAGKSKIDHYISKNLDMQKINFAYATMEGGDDKLTPDTVFDDGDWTYFQFKKKNGQPQSFPVVYQVLDGYDTPANTRIEGDYLIAETLSRKWTLRAGEAHLCVGAIEEKE